MFHSHRPTVNLKVLKRIQEVLTPGFTPRLRRITCTDFILEFNYIVIPTQNIVTYQMAFCVLTDPLSRLNIVGFVTFLNLVFEKQKLPFNLNGIWSAGAAGHETYLPVTRLQQVEDILEAGD